MEVGSRTAPSSYSHKYDIFSLPCQGVFFLIRSLTFRFHGQVQFHGRLVCTSSYCESGRISNSDGERSKNVFLDSRSKSSLFEGIIVSLGYHNRLSVFFFQLFHLLGTIAIWFVFEFHEKKVRLSFV